MTPSQIGAMLGALTRGVPKNLSKAERERRRRSLAKARLHRWKNKTQKTGRKARST